MKKEDIWTITVWGFVILICIGIFFVFILIAIEGVNREEFCKDEGYDGYDSYSEKGYLRCCDDILRVPDQNNYDFKEIQDCKIYEWESILS